MRVNTVSAFHIAEELGAAAFPVAIPKVTAIVMLTREPADADNPTIQLTISLGGRSLFESPIVVGFSQRLSARAVVDINGLVIPGPGTVRFALRDGNRDLGTWDVIVNQVGQPGIHTTALPARPAPAQPGGNSD